MSLDGLRAWIGEVERKLGMRTRVFLVLVAIAIGGAAAGIYLALEAANESVSKDEVRALQERAEGTAGEASAGAEAAAVATLKAEVESLRSQLSELQTKGASPPPEGSGSPTGKSGATEPAPEAKGASPPDQGEAKHK